MKEPLKDRIDVLFEKANAGDADAQLKLAKNFQKGHLVEKSEDLAKYWVFKAVSAGNESAIPFYQQLNLGVNINTSKTFDNVVGFLAGLPVYEFCAGILGFLISWLFGLKDSILDDISTWLFCVGGASFIFALAPAGKISETKYKQYFNVVLFIGLVVVHVAGVIIALK